MHSVIWTSLLAFLIAVDVTNSQSSKCKFNLGVYYETKCPDSKMFIVNQLWPAYNSISEIMDIDLVPFGKASFETNGTSYSFNCQHGQSECEGNMMQACAKNQLTVDQLMKLVTCMERNRAPEQNLQRCGDESKIATAAIKDCTKSADGPRLLKALGDRTFAVKPAITFVPSITIDGKHDTTFEYAALRNLKKALCDRCQGTKPSGCAGL